MSTECANGVLNKSNKVKRCGEILPILFISPDGLIKPCTMWREEPIGDLKTQSFWEVWEGDEFVQPIKYFT